MIEHVGDRAGFLAALPTDDPERTRAFEHARVCNRCSDALAEGARLVTLLRASAPPAPAVSPRELARGAAAIRAETLDESGALHQLSWVAAGSVAVAWAFQLMVGSGLTLGVRHVAVSLVVLGVALASATLLRRKAAGLAVVVVLLTSGLLAHGAGTMSGLEAGIGVRCMFRELWAAAIPWVAVGVFARRRGLTLGRGDVTVLAASGALAGHAGQHLACQVPHADAHLIAFHFSAVALSVLLGALSFRAVSPIGDAPV